MDQQLLTLYCDGLCEPNPGGWATWGWVAIDAAGEIVAQAHGDLGRGYGRTNNVAEYQAVVEALRWAYKAGHRAAAVRSDSLLVINQVLGEWHCTAPALMSLLATVR